MTSPRRTAMLLIDVINPFDFPGGAALLRHAIPAAARISRLAERFRGRGWPVIYVNDNHGQWRSNFAQAVETCARPAARGRAFVSALLPGANDYFVLKPQQSAFFRTPLEDLLHRLRIRSLVLTGIAGDGCVLASAIDAKMRDYAVRVPGDCVASATGPRNRAALTLLRQAFDVPTGVSASIRTSRAAPDGAAA